MKCEPFGMILWVYLVGNKFIIENCKGGVLSISEGKFPLFIEIKKYWFLKHFKGIMLDCHNFVLLT